ncbi:MAG: HEPN domain-containing protein [Candidatus Altiarchaeota archaeon]
MTNEVETWLKQAVEDLETANILYKNKKYKAAAFYCQQAVEKAFKAVSIKKLVN